ARFKPEPLVKVAAQPFVPLDHCLAATESGLDLDRQLNNVLVRSIESRRFVRHFECAGGVTRLKPEAANPLEETQAERGQPTLFGIYPERVDPCEWLSAEECERSFEQRGRVFFVGAGLLSKPVEFVEVDH